MNMLSRGPRIRSGAPDPNIYGQKFDLITDHKPLEALYGLRSKPCARIERSVLRLQPYDFHVVHIHTSKTQQTRFTSTWGFLFQLQKHRLFVSQKGGTIIK